jgi:hypothetical protein
LRSGTKPSLSGVHPPATGWLSVFVQGRGEINDAAGYGTPRESRRREPLALSALHAMQDERPDGKMRAPDECRLLGAEGGSVSPTERQVQPQP